MPSQIRHFSALIAATLFSCALSAGTLTLTSASFSTTEDPGSSFSGIVNITVQRTGDMSNFASAQISATNGTAVDGSDFLQDTETLTWVPFQWETQTFHLQILNDSFNEPTETFTVTLSNVVGDAVGEPSAATVTITDDDVSAVVTSTSQVQPTA
jgi:hypothetical protein